MATTEYVTLAAVRKSMNLTPAPGPEDDDLNLAIAGASRAIDEVTGRRFWIDDEATMRVLTASGKSTWTRQGEHLLIVPDIATATGIAVAVGSFTGGSYTPLTPAVFPVYRGDGIEGQAPIVALVLASGEWPAGAGSRLQITARWGWPTVPKNIEVATGILARRLFKRKDTPAGIMGSQEWVTNIARQDPDVKTLIERFELAGFG